MEEKNELIKALYEENDKLKADLAECQINLREADAHCDPPPDQFSQMLGRIGIMIPLEFYQTREATVEQAVALLLSRYYSEMSTITYNQNKKLNP